MGLENRLFELNLERDVAVLWAHDISCVRVSLGVLVCAKQVELLRDLDSFLVKFL